MLVGSLSMIALIALTLGTRMKKVPQLDATCIRFHWLVILLKAFVGFVEEECREVLFSILVCFYFDTHSPDDALFCLNLWVGVPL